MKYLAIALATAALMGAQTPGISIRPNMMSPSTGSGAAAVAVGHLGAPILGYVGGPGPLELHTILGAGKSAQVGGLVALPSGVNHFFLPPREHYLLLESKEGEPLTIWQPQRAVAVPMAMTHPDKVVFSGRGDAAVLTAKSGDSLQIITGLPAQPVVAVQPALGERGEAARFAISDDGGALVASLTDGTAMVSLHGGEWQRLPAAYRASAVLFVARTHNLVVSDAGQQTLTLVTNVAEPTQAARILAHNVSADRLAVTREGNVLVAAAATQSKVWLVDLKTMTAGPVSSAPIDMLLPLRDGHTFLLSASGFGLLSVPVESDSATSLVPVTR